MLTVVYPEGLNWFYRHQAQMLDVDFLALGVDTVAVASEDLEQLRDRNGTVLLMSAWECVEAAEKAGCGSDFRALVRRFDRRVLVNYDSLQTHYFTRHFIDQVGLVTEIIDVTMLRQTSLPSLYGVPYHWISEAFCRSESRSIEAWEPRRPVPWAILGHANSSRATLASICTELLGANGLVFMPPIRPFRADSGLDRSGIHNVLRRCDMYVWGSHHSVPYHEGLRALHAIAAGAVPAKIDPLHSRNFTGIPWVYRSVGELVERRDEIGLDALYRQAHTFLQSRGTMSELILDALGTEYRASADGATPDVASRSGE